MTMEDILCGPKGRILQQGLYQGEPYNDEGHSEIMVESLQGLSLPPLSKILSVLLSAKPQELYASTSFQSTRHLKGSIDRALRTLQHHANAEINRTSNLGKLIIPLLEHVTKSRDRSNRKQVLSIMSWLFRNENMRKPLVNGLVAILESNKDNPRIQLGWCITVREILQQIIQKTDFSIVVHDDEFIGLVKCIPNLFLILDTSSKDMPRRLSVMAADCIILLSKCASDRTILSADSGSKCTSATDVSFPLRESYQLQEDVEEVSISGGIEISSKEHLLWEQLDILLNFVLRLKKWNQDSRPLYAKGLHQIAKCLENLATLRDSIISQDGNDFVVPTEVLSSYWNRYSLLMLTDASAMRSDPQAELENWIEGLKYTLHIEIEGGNDMSPGRADELRVFFLTCSSLLLGRLVPVELEGILQECGPVLLQALFGLLRSKHEDVLDLAIAILRALLFQSGAFEGTTLKMNIVAPLLMDLLDERDATCKAAVALIADYFAMNPCAPEMEKLFRLLGSENLAQRQNALAVISELLQALSSSDHDMADGIRKLVAVHLLKHLGDTELVNRLEISRLFSKLDPEFVLPALVHNVYSRDEKVRSAASASIIALLKHHSDSCVTLCVLLDSTRNIIHNAQLPSHPGQIAISKNTLSSDVDRVMHLIRNWAREEHDWEQKIDVILKKMFLEPSNPVIPRFLSEINTQLLKNIDSVFRNVLCFMIEQKQLLENLSAKGKQGDGSFQESAESFVFEKLSPLLVLKVLPLAAFDKSCREFYGRTVENGGHFDLKDVCIMHFLLDRACGEYEAYEVRKLSSELLGRCNPGIVLPVLETRLKNGIKGRHFLEMKSCLFSLCNLVMLRGTLALQNPCMVSIRLLLFQVLMWPCSPTDADTYNVQYGCIDCLALIIVAELGSSSTEKSSGYQNFGWKFLDKRVIEEVGAETNSSDGNFESVQAAFQQSVLLLVVSCLVDQNHANTFLLGQLQLQNANDGASYADDFTIHASFRICMGNVLIRATQQISTKDRSGFLSYTMPIILDYIQVAKDGHVLSVCLQFLFSVVHNFKDQTLPYAIDFFNLSLRIIRSKASSEERLAATRLLASLMSSTDIVMNEVAPLLPQAVHVLETVSRIDPSSELRILCEKLLECMVSSP